RGGHGLRGMREHGLSRAEAEERFDQEGKDERAKRGLESHGDVVPPPEGTIDSSDMSDADVLTLARVAPQLMPSQFQYDEGALASFGEFTLHQGIPSRLANALVDWWGSVVVSAAGGDIDWDDAEQTFNESFPELSAEQRATLARWMRDIHGVP